MDSILEQTCSLNVRMHTANHSIDINKLSSLAWRIFGGVTGFLHLSYTEVQQSKVQHTRGKSPA